MQRTNDYENMVCEFERMLCLLNLIWEELDDAPRCKNNEDAWKAVVYCNRSELMEALVNSVWTMIKTQKETMEQWIEMDRKGW